MLTWVYFWWAGDQAPEGGWVGYPPSSKRSALRRYQRCAVGCILENGGGDSRGGLSAVVVAVVVESEPARSASAGHHRIARGQVGSGHGRHRGRAAMLAETSLGRGEVGHGVVACSFFRHCNHQPEPTHLSWGKHRLTLVVLGSAALVPSRVGWGAALLPSDAAESNLTVSKRLEVRSRE